MGFLFCAVKLLDYWFLKDNFDSRITNFQEINFNIEKELEINKKDISFFILFYNIQNGINNTSLSLQIHNPYCSFLNFNGLF